MNSKKGISLILLSALMFGSYGIWSRLMGGYFDVFYQGWTRALIITVLLFPFLYLKKQLVLIKKNDMRWFITYLCFTSFTQAPLYYAYNHMDIGTATVLFFATMLLTMYSFGFIFLGEKLSKVKIMAFIIACAGLFVSFSFSLTAFSLLAAFMAILNGVASGGEVSSSKKLSGTYSALYITWLSWVIILITNLPVSLLLGEVQHLPSFSIVWLYQLGYVIAGIVGFWSIIEGLKYVEASIGGLIGLLEVVFSIVFGIIIFSEGLNMRSGLGALLVLSAASLPHIAEIYRNKFSLKSSS
ncbi:MAG: DMT family transporter [Candidatus Pacebacteria bacterium]|jgi:drug/metabolite transporter (DMT)-like permease|nr:DMT family transporter [Candidatus Paceibacterota bacterium]MBT4652155.1 DMT family transporter [Candidatus Paceibacterota bacterium]MBT6756693.1 DMT family transporter [Candidatus Paceibacterota bacterium]MBT6920963.1 DMT family transporter [Candidatus Paceibacterota bacterium]